MKKILAFIVTALVLVFGIRYGSLYRDKLSMESVSEVGEVSSLDLVLNFGDEIATYSAEIEGEISVLGLLKNSGGIEHKIDIKDYDFGSLVVGIDEYTNTLEKSWIYFVNGKSGEVGANEKMVGDGDVVEWKYIKPAF